MDMASVVARWLITIKRVAVIDSNNSMMLRFSAGGSAGLARQVAAINGPVRACGIALTTGAVEAMVHATVFDESHPSLGVH